MSSFSGKLIIAAGTILLVASIQQAQAQSYGTTQFFNGTSQTLSFAGARWGSLSTGSGGTTSCAITNLQTTGHNILKNATETVFNANGCPIQKTIDIVFAYVLPTDANTGCVFEVVMSYEYTIGTGNYYYNNYYATSAKSAGSNVTPVCSAQASGPSYVEFPPNGGYFDGLFSMKGF